MNPRAVVLLAGETRVGGDGRWERALVRDLSAGGAGVYTSAPLPLQAEVHLRLALPGEETALELSAMVVRSGPAQGTTEELSHFAGLYFLALPEPVQARIRAIVWHQIQRERKP